MPLHNKAILEVSAFDRTGAFGFRGELAPNREVTRTFLVGGRGQVVSELYSQASDFDPTDTLPDADLERRAGFHLDAGAGKNVFQYSADVGVGDEDLPWGDGSGGDNTVSEYDASGDVPPLAKRDVLLRWLSQARSDSGGQMLLHTGEWCDGTYASEAGVFGEPVPVALRSVRTEKASDEPSAVTYTFEFERTSLVPDAVDAAVEDLSDAAASAVTAVGDIIPYW